MWLWAASLVLSIAPAETSGQTWWWVAGDSGDAVALFVDEGSVRRDGDRASVRAVSVARDGTPGNASWEGRCAELPTDPGANAVARFACASDAQRMETAALLGGLTPLEAAQAIFNVRTAREPAVPAT